MSDGVKESNFLVSAQVNVVLAHTISTLTESPEQMEEIAARLEKQAGWYPPEDRVAYLAAAAALRLIIRNADTIANPLRLMEDR